MEQEMERQKQKERQRDKETNKGRGRKHQGHSIYNYEGRGPSFRPMDIKRGISRLFNSNYKVAYPNGQVKMRIYLFVSLKVQGYGWLRIQLILNPE